MDERLAGQIDSRFDAYLKELFGLLRQPSISATGEGMDACADLVGELFERHGFDDWQRIETARYPIVYAERLADESDPTVVFYGHYDVQPPGDTELWGSPPFEPTVRDGAVYARGSGDNKGQFVAHAFAIDALEGIDELPRVNVKCLIEGGEESGSAGLIDYLAGEPNEIRDADLVYVADGPMHRSRRPTLIYGNRGLLSLQLDHRTANADLHSGNFGGPVPNAANELVALLATMFDGDRVTVDGFYDEVRITPADRTLAAAVPCDDDAIKAELGLDRFASETPYYERLLLEPTLSINGVASGYAGEGMKTIIPHEASAKVDMRLVPDQEPGDVLDLVRSHVAARNPSIRVTELGRFPPMRTPIDTPAAAIVKAAMRDVRGEAPVEMPMLGGSLPVAHFRTKLDLPVLIVPYANPDQNNHSPNEHLDLDCFRDGIGTSARFLQRWGTST